MKETFSLGRLSPPYLEQKKKEKKHLNVGCQWKKDNMIGLNDNLKSHLGLFPVYHQGNNLSRIVISCIILTINLISSRFYNLKQIYRPVINVESKENMGSIIISFLGLCARVILEPMKLFARPFYLNASFYNPNRSFWNKTINCGMSALRMELAASDKPELLLQTSVALTKHSTCVGSQVSPLQPALFKVIQM